MRGPEIALAVTASVGVAAVLWLVCSSVFGLRLVTFETGSMSPSMPTGTLALAVETAAADLSVGDVVTVDRGEELPVTHRIVEIAPAGGSGDSATLTLKGDANREPDATTYEVASGLRVLAWVPGLAPLAAVLKSSAAAGIFIMLVGGLLTWNLLPRKGQQVLQPAEAVG